MDSATHQAKGPLGGLRLEYSADLSLLPPGVAFLQLGFDQGAEHYVKQAVKLRHGRVLTWLHGLLTTFLSDFDATGLLDVYPMHVLSEAQWGIILEQTRGAEPQGPSQFGHLLDIGAGRGDVTAQLGRHFSRITVSETSKPMARRLARMGFDVISGDISKLPSGPGTFDVVSLLNVLDRCEFPLQLLSAARTLVRAGGLLVIALVLPYEPVLLAGGESLAPAERLPISSTSFERAASELILYGLMPLGLKVELISRVPYLSGGDAHCPLYELDDLIVVCRADGDLPLIGSHPDPKSSQSPRQ